MDTREGRAAIQRLSMGDLLDAVGAGHVGRERRETHLTNGRATWKASP